MVFIGIDPAFRSRGFSICIIDNKNVTFKTFKRGFLGFCFWFMNESPGAAICAVENSNLINATFNTIGNKNIIARKSRDAGKNQAVSQNTSDLLSTKYKVFDISPKEKGGKWTAAAYEQIIKAEGYTPNKKRSNQDERDAFKLALICIRKYKFFNKK